MRLKIYILPLVLILIFTTTSFSQEKVLVNGIVTDEERNAPIEGVSITSKNSRSGTVSNKEGKFLLYIAATAIPDTLFISRLGYTSRKVPVNEKTSGRPLAVQLELQTETLAEVVITTEDPMFILQEAIRKIPYNYLQQEHIQKGFYRTSTKKEGAYIQLSEAVFDVSNYGYSNPKKNILSLTKVRSLRNEKESHGIELGLKPNLLFDYDMVKMVADHPVFSPKGLKSHKFILKGVVNYNGAEAYEIAFDQKENIEKSLYKGTIYILKDEKAIVEANYGLSPKGIQYARYGDFATRALLKLLDLSIQIKKEDVAIRYRMFGNRWVLSDVNNNTVLQFKNSRKQFDFTADVAVNYVNTAIDTIIPLVPAKALGNNKFIENEKVEPDTAFWKDYTIILPDFPVDAVVKKINEANNTYNLKKTAQLYMNGLKKRSVHKLDSLLTFYQVKGQFNGTAMIVHEDSILLDKSYGYANIEKHTKADRNTRYRIGSLSKFFTAIVIMQMVNDGKIDLNAPISKYLPDYKHREITVSQLLSHTSGLPNCTSNNAYLGELASKQMSRKEIVSKFCSDSLEFYPGSKFAYSNSGYILLAYLAETIEHKDFGIILKERIFDPLNMKDTYSGWNPFSVNTASGYLYGQREPEYFAINLTGAGGITSTAADLVLWNKGLLEGKLLPDSRLMEMYTPRSPYTDWTAAYGYGCMLDEGLFAVSKKSKIYYHPGTDLGFYAMFVKKDDSKSLIILLSNTGDFPRFDLTDLILSNLD